MSSWPSASILSISLKFFMVLCMPGGHKFGVALARVFWDALACVLSRGFFEEVFVAGDFVSELACFMGSLGLTRLEGSGLEFPEVGWSWGDCCRACLWLSLRGHELPENLESRLTLGPQNEATRLYFEWVSSRGGLALPFDFCEL